MSAALVMRNSLISNLLSDFKILIASWGDLRLFTIALAVWAGVLLDYGIGFIRLLISALAIISLILLSRRTRRSKNALLLLAIILFGALLMNFRLSPLQALSPYMGKHVNVEVVVIR